MPGAKTVHVIGAFLLSRGWGWVKNCFRSRFDIFRVRYVRMVACTFRPASILSKATLRTPAIFTEHSVLVQAWCFRAGFENRISQPSLRAKNQKWRFHQMWGEWYTIAFAQLLGILRAPQNRWEKFKIIEVQILDVVGCLFGCFSDWAECRAIGSKWRAVLLRKTRRSILDVCYNFGFRCHRG